MEIKNSLNDTSELTEQFEKLCLGIDFGTTNSCLSVWYKNKQIIIPDFDGSDTIPTIIELDIDKKIIGREAYIRKSIFNKTSNQINKTTFVIYEIKKLLGKKFSELDDEFINMLAYDICPDDEDNIIIIDKNSKRKYYPEEIAIHIFMSFKHRAESYLSNKFNYIIEIKNSVISVPAYFNKNQRQIIKNSAENSGLNVIRLINEPTAAAICYGLGKNIKNDGINILVFDFGGGTLDVSLLNINNGVYEVLGSCGNNNLGGSDFDTKIMEFIINKFINDNELNYNVFIDNVEEDSLQKLKYLCEQAKISLSDNISTKIKINNFYSNIDLAINFNREDFNNITQDLVRLIIKPINDVLNNCEIEKSKIDEIIMVGGMTRVPFIRYNIEKYFNKDVNCSVDPDIVVSIGCAIHGYMILNKENIKDKLLLIDRTSLSIGLETTGGIMDVLIPLGSIIPIKKIKKYTTDTDYIESIDIKIFEGERKFTKDNFLIGNFILNGIEKQKRGIPEIQITFEVDTDGIIKIKAEDLENPLNKKVIQVSGNKQNLTNEQIQKIILNAKEMDQIDKIDKLKKEYYLSLIDSSQKIIENINSENLQLSQDIKNSIINNVQEILDWLNNNKYDIIDIEKYKELIHDYKINYSIYMIQQNSHIINLESADNKDEKGIEIYDNDNTKYIEQIKYFRQIIDEYDNIKKQIYFIKEINKDLTDINDKNIDINDKNIVLDNINLLIEDLNIIYQFSNDILLKFFINNDLNDDIVDNYINQLYEYDLNFKEKFNEFNKEYDIINKLINKIKEKEDFLLNKLENLENSIIDINEKNKLENNIILKLDIIIEFQSYIYKITSGYASFDKTKISDIINFLENFNC